MTTLIVHGTKLIAGAQHTSWWYQSWAEGGFLHALAGGMVEADGWHDVWTVHDVPVGDVRALNSKWSFWTGRMGQVSAHEGHFIWSGADMGAARDAGASALALYLNTIRELTDEPIRIVAYSHGCNVVKGASVSRQLKDDVFIEDAVFLACPHFYAESAGQLVLTYRADPARFGRILNLYTEEDTVQVGFADAVTGPGGGRWPDWVPPHAARTDQDPDTEHLYETWCLGVEEGVSGIRAHSVIHGAIAGRIAGLWLNGMKAYADIAGAFGGDIPPIPEHDDGA